jgi:hypothetical protein
VIVCAPIARLARHGKTYGPMGDTDYTAFDQALERIENALGAQLPRAFDAGVPATNRHP